MTDSSQDSIPRHVAIIMDGNGRWAKQRHLPRIRGHEEGARSIEACLKVASERAVEYLTLYAFSVENWSRPSSEIDALMKLLDQTLIDYRDKLIEEGVRLHAIGRLEDLPDHVRDRLQDTIEATAQGTRLNLVLALSYGSRVELVEACRQLAIDVRDGKIEPGAITEPELSRRLYTSEIPDPDLLIRTSGERRLSNFLLWQLSYTEIHFSPVLWPDFREQEFESALEDYATRKRRFGAIDANES
jgi:undecaprenyl diphosphate synthase